jgi:hypothetical protein
MGDQPVARSLPTQNTTNKKKRTQTSMPQMGFEATTPVVEQAKMVHALDCMATVIGKFRYTGLNMCHAYGIFI